MSTVTAAAIHRARVLFDLNGYYIVKNVLSKAEIVEARETVLKHSADFKERKGDVHRNSTGAKQQKFAGDGLTGRFDLGGILDWSDCEVFRNVLCHENLVPYLHLIVGKGYRLDHSPFVIKQTEGSEGFNLHGGPNRKLQYSVLHGEISTTLLGCVVFINPQTKEDGGFCVVKGSHKSNFPLPDHFHTGEDAAFFEDHVSPVGAEPGDVVLFSEATVHGSFAWTNSDRDRLMALYRFAPATNAYARGYLDFQYDQRKWTERQLAVVQPPYDARFERPALKEDGKGTESRKRSEDKKAFDEEVFGQSFY